MFRQALQSLLQARLVLGRDLFLEPATPPPVSGVYAWWFSAGPGGAPLDGCQCRDEWHLLYVGIAPRRPAEDGRPSRQNLRARLRQHLKCNASASTLRFTLGCLLASELGLRLEKGGSASRLSFGPGERLLSAWMAEHAKVSWLEHPQPWEMEREALAGLSLPLNRDGNRSHPFSAEVGRLRSFQRERARSSLDVPA